MLKHTFSHFSSAFLAAFAACVIVCAGTAVQGQTTGFTYQGQLQSSSALASGSYDFEFLLYDALSGGNQIGATLSRSSVSVANGIFSVPLDFGSNFPGANRFLEIHVRQTGGGAFTLLLPRQAVSTDPYSIKSLNADTALNATNATNAANLTSPLAGDVTGTQGTTTVTRLQGRNLANTLPANGQVLKFNTATNQWEPNTDNTSAGGGGTITGVTPGTGLTGGGTTGNVTLNITNGGVGTTQLADGGVTGGKITAGQVVKNINGLTDSVTLAAGTNITLTPSGNALTIAAPGALASVSHDTSLSGNGTGGSTLGINVPLQLSGSAAGSIVSVTNTGAGTGVYGYSPAGQGVYGASIDGKGVLGFSSYNTGVDARSSSGFGVSGQSTFGTGVYGESGTLAGQNPAIYGKTFAADPAGIGVYGFSGTGRGVQGNSDTGTGVFGFTNTGAGVYGASATGPGVSGTSDSGNIIEGYGNGGLKFRVTNSGRIDGQGICVGPYCLENPGRIIAGGLGGEFTFLDRTVNSFVDNPTNGQRWLWYASGSKARLWSGSDKLSIDPSGNLTITGCISASNIACASDSRLKEHVKSLSYGLGEVLRLRPVSWQWKDTATTQPNLGLVAQEVEPILPELVLHNVDDKNSLGLNYMGLIPVLVKGIQQQQAQIEAQAKQIEKQNAVNKNQEAEIEALKALVCRSHRSAAACRAAKK